MQRIVVAHNRMYLHCTPSQRCDMNDPHSEVRVQVEPPGLVSMIEAVLEVSKQLLAPDAGLPLVSGTDHCFVVHRIYIWERKVLQAHGWR